VFAFDNAPCPYVRFELSFGNNVQVMMLGMVVNEDGERFFLVKHHREFAAGVDLVRQVVVAMTLPEPDFEAVALELKVVVAFKAGNLRGFQGIGGVGLEFLGEDTEC
jgi:hypothetical protein